MVRNSMPYVDECYGGTSLLAHGSHLQILWQFLGLGQGITKNFEVHTFAETTAVHFSKLSEQEIAAYIATGAHLVLLQKSAASAFTLTKQQALALLDADAHFLVTHFAFS